MDNASVEVMLIICGTSCNGTLVSQEDALAKLLQVSFLAKNILKIPATQCSLVHFERSAQAIQKIIGSIKFNTDKIRKPYLTVLFLKYLYKLKRGDKLCQKQINSLPLLITSSKILFFSSSWLETLLI